MKITGNMINYYFVCQRKLWLFAQGLQYEEENENVQLGNYWIRVHTRTSENKLW